MDALQNAKSSLQMIEQSMRFNEGDPSPNAVNHAIVATAYALVALVECLDSLSVPLDIDRARNALLIADADKE